MAGTSFSHNVRRCLSGGTLRRTHGDSGMGHHRLSTRGMGQDRGGWRPRRCRDVRPDLTLRQGYRGAAARQVQGRGREGIRGRLRQGDIRMDPPQGHPGQGRRHGKGGLRVRVATRHTEVRPQGRRSGGICTKVHVVRLPQGTHHGCHPLLGERAGGGGQHGCTHRCRVRVLQPPI